MNNLEYMVCLGTTINTHDVIDYIITSDRLSVTEAAMIIRRRNKKWRKHILYFFCADIVGGRNKTILHGASKVTA